MMKESGINENQMANRNYVTTMMTTVKKQQKETHGNIEIGKLHATNRRRKKGMMKDVRIHCQGFLIDKRNRSCILALCQ
jgi:primosomal replication protein N